MTLSTFATALLFSRLAFASPVSNRRVSNNSSLTWVPCDLDFPPEHKGNVTAHGAPIYCTTLRVPLDYTNSKSSATLDLQLIKVEATKEPFKGSIIMNPGGPGNSGVDEISKNGPMYRDVFGGHFDVIGFDARGTGRTMPFACNPVNTTASSLTKRAEIFTIPQMDVYPLLTSKAWNDAKLFVDSCAETEGNKEIASFLGTPFVAQDMLNIVDAIGEDGLLRFWGRSYSTILGQTFAAMFPDRVGRILLDSTLRLDDYYSGQWNTATRGTEKSVKNFFAECVKSGTTLCPLANYTGPDTTAEFLHQELGKALQDLIDDPVMMPPTFAPAGQPWWQPRTTLYQVVKYAFLTQTYRPDQFLSLHAIANLTLHRDWTALSTVPEPQASNTTAEVVLPWNLGVNAFHGVGCSDAANRADRPEDLYSVIRAQAVGGSWGDVFGPQVWVCAQWPFRAAERFEGPFAGINTSHPILLVNGAYDPITPLSGAWEASANLMGSRLLVHNGHGHGLMNHPSACTIKAIHDYFNDGTLPEVGTVCEPDQPAFELALEAVSEVTGDGNSK